MTAPFLTVLPSAGRLMVSLRDIGYDPASAIADLIDNAIDACALHVSIDVVPEGPDSWVRATDDGLGMTVPLLDEAMRYGSHAEYDASALGHFGLGMKTASLSQCRRLTVASRGTLGGRIAARRWDLDEVLRRDSWDLERVAPNTADRRLTEPLVGGGTGTVVLWETLDRLLPRKPTPGMTSRVLRSAIDDIRDHLAMVFHRFLDGQAYSGRQRLTLTLNGERIDAWDPFASDELHTTELPAQSLEYEAVDGEVITVEVRPFVLPGQQLFSSVEAHRRAAGPQRWNRQQGFYIYRRERLIQAGGWNRLRTLDEHAKLARIAIDLPVGEEDRFAVDIAKMRVSIPDELRPSLRAVAAATVSVAQERYRDHLDDAARPAPDRSDPPTFEAISISRDWGVIMAVIDDVLALDPELRDRLLLRLANADPDDAALLSAQT
jgi:hypothetical protein